MFCGNCGFKADANGRFCPKCGSPIQVDPVINIDPVDNDIKNKPVQKNSKNFIAIIIAVVAVIGIAIAVIFAVKGGGAKGGADNAFAKAEKQTKKNSSAHEVLDILSAAHGTVFDSESLSLSVDAGYDKYNFKIQNGKDLASTNFYADLFDDIYIALVDGKFIYTDGYDAVEVDAKDMLKNRGVIETQILNAIKSEVGYSSEGNSIYDSIVSSQKDIDESLIELIKNKNINFDAIDTISKTALACVTVLEPEYFRDLKSLSFWYKKAADFIATLPDDAITVTKDVNGKGKNAATSYTVKINFIDVLQALVEFVDNDQELKSCFGPEFLDYYLGSDMREELALDKKNYYDQYNMVFSAEVTGDRLTRFGIDISGIKIAISGINDTVVSSSEYEKVAREAEECDKVVINSYGDILEQLYDIF